MAKNNALPATPQGYTTPESITPLPRHGIRSIPLRLPTRPSAPDRDSPDLRLIAPKFLSLFRELAHGLRPRPLLLDGPPGTGKSWGARAAVECVEPTLYMDFETILDRVLSRDPKLWQEVAHAELIVIDEIGARRKATDLAFSTSKRVLDIRDEHCGRVGIYIRKRRAR